MRPASCASTATRQRWRGNPSWTPTVSSDSLPTVVASVGAIACPSSTTCLATAVGDQSSASDPTVITVDVAGSGPSTWTPESTFPTGASSVTALSCGGTTCVAIGSATGGAGRLDRGSLGRHPQLGAGQRHPHLGGVGHRGRLWQSVGR